MKFVAPSDKTGAKRSAVVVTMAADVEIREYDLQDVVMPGLDAAVAQQFGSERTRSAGSLSPDAVGGSSPAGLALFVDVQQSTNGVLRPQWTDSPSGATGGATPVPRSGKLSGGAGAAAASKFTHSPREVGSPPDTVRNSPSAGVKSINLRASMVKESTPRQQAARPSSRDSSVGDGGDGGSASRVSRSRSSRSSVERR